MPRTGRANT